MHLMASQRVLGYLRKQFGGHGDQLRHTKIPRIRVLVVHAAELAWLLGVGFVHERHQRGKLALFVARVEFKLRGPHGGSRELVVRVGLVQDELPFATPIQHDAREANGRGGHERRQHAMEMVILFASVGCQRTC